MDRLGVIERAFELAGEYSTLSKLAGRLEREGYSSVFDHLMSPTLRAELRSRLQKEDSDISARK